MGAFCIIWSKISWSFSFLKYSVGHVIFDSEMSCLELSCTYFWELLDWLLWKLYKFSIWCIHSLWQTLKSPVLNDSFNGIQPSHTELLFSGRFTFIITEKWMIKKYLVSSTIKSEMQIILHLWTKFVLWEIYPFQNLLNVQSQFFFFFL